LMPSNPPCPAAFQAGMAELVVDTALLVVREHLVGLVISLNCLRRVAWLRSGGASAPRAGTPCALVVRAATPTPRIRSSRVWKTSTFGDRGRAAHPRPGGAHTCASLRKLSLDRPVTQFFASSGGDRQLLPSCSSRVACWLSRRGRASALRPTRPGCGRRALARAWRGRPARRGRRQRGRWRRPWRPCRCLVGRPTPGAAGGRRRASAPAPRSSRRSPATRPRDGQREGQGVEALVEAAFSATRRLRPKRRGTQARRSPPPTVSRRVMRCLNMCSSSAPTRSSTIRSRLVTRLEHTDGLGALAQVSSNREAPRVRLDELRQLRLGVASRAPPFRTIRALRQLLHLRGRDAPASARAHLSTPTTGPPAAWPRPTRAPARSPWQPAPQRISPAREAAPLRAASRSWSSTSRRRAAPRLVERAPVASSRARASSSSPRRAPPAGAAARRWRTDQARPPLARQATNASARGRSPRAACRRSPRARLVADLGQRDAVKGSCAIIRTSANSRATRSKSA